jgi:hypothetical protein
LQLCIGTTNTSKYDGQARRRYYKKTIGTSNGLKSYKEIITTKSVTDVGFFNVHKVDSKYYFEIPEDILGRDILVVNRIAKAPAGLRSGGSFLAMAAIR